MGVEDGSGEKPGDIPKIEWKGAVSPEEVARRNSTAAEGRGVERPGEKNRDALLAGLDREMIQLGRKKAVEVLAVTTRDERIQSEKMIDAMTNSQIPKYMISILVGLDERTRADDAIRYAAMAQALLNLTEGY